MVKPLRLFGQVVVYGAIALLFGIFSDSPSYTHLPPDQAQLKLSFAHSAAPREACRKLTREELKDVAANMRRTEVCPRERLPVLVELLVDGVTLYRESLPPTGLFGDGPSLVYERFVIAPGRHRLVVRLRDSARTEGFDYRRTAEIDLGPRQSLAIDFRAETGGFILFGAQGER
jgi:hypothetical protein